ncbi:HIT family protein [Methylomonas paludis]|uniref:HIT family protein n=1 Tax=Methylomonas paludis TaxID=1173101 RepID=UPI0031BA3C65
MGGVRALLSAYGLSEIVASTENFLVILDVAPITAGHALVIPRLHEHSLSILWRDLSEKLEQVVSAVVTTLNNETGKAAIICEHGLGSEAKGHAGCVEHAHLHIIPFDYPLLSAFSHAGINFTQTDNLLDITKIPPTQQYLYLRDTDGLQYLAVQEKFPSQLVRRLVATQLGELYWSWRDYLDFSDKIGTKQRIIEGMKLFAHLNQNPVFMDDL